MTFPGLPEGARATSNNRCVIYQMQLRPHTYYQLLVNHIKICGVEVQFKKSYS